MALLSIARIIFAKRTLTQNGMSIDQLAEGLRKPGALIIALEEKARLQACQLITSQDLNNPAVTNTSGHRSQNTGITNADPAKPIQGDFKGTGIEAVLKVYRQMSENLPTRRAVYRKLQRGEPGL